MTTRFASLAACLLLAGVLAGCLTDEDFTYTGPPQVEFSPTSRAVADGAGAVELTVQLIGEQRPQPVEIGYEVDAGLTTAVEGVHYALDGAMTLTLAANASSAGLGVTILDADHTEAVRLALTLTGNDTAGVIPAANYKTFLLTIRPD